MKNVIFIGSAPRSGSTILDMMLGNGAGCFSLGEVSAHYRPYWKHHFDSVCACGNPDCEVRKSFERVPEKGLFDHVFDTLGAETAVDSSKSLAWILDHNIWLSGREDVNVTNVLIYKHPVSLAHSYFKRGFPLDRYKEKFTYYTKFIESGMPFVSIEYADLVEDPADAIAKLCNYIGIPYFEGKEKYWNKEMHHFFGSPSVLHQREEGKIKSKEVFQEDFKPLIPEVEGGIQSDPKLLQTFQALQANKAGSVDMQPPVKSLQKPLWYYRSKIKSAYQRVFPEDYSKVKVSRQRKNL